MSTNHRPYRISLPSSTGWVTLALFAAMACGGGDGEVDPLGSSTPTCQDCFTSELESNLELFSWWVNAGEADALASLLDVFSDEYPDVVVTNSAAQEPTTARDRLIVRMNAGEPPDSFQAISGVDLLSWVEQGRMTPLTSLAESNGWDSAFPPEVLDILSVDGELYAVPINIERDNNLYYNVEVLDDAGLEPPETLDDFFRACDELETSETIPLAVPAAGWVLALVAFENLMPSLFGGQYYLDFFAGEADLDGQELEEFFTQLKALLECSNVSTASPSWGESADLVYEGKAAMYVMGDWAKGYFERGENAGMDSVEPWVAGEDFGVVPGLGSRGYFVFNSAVFGLPRGAQHPQAAKAFLGIVASRVGQEAFNPVKGSVPARIDVSLDGFDDMVKGAAADFDEAARGEARLLPGYASLTTFEYQKEVNPSLLVFAVGGARARLLDPDNVPEEEEVFPPLDLDYILGKMRTSYAILED